MIGLQLLQIQQHWAAFFSYVEHEVLPVSEGYRVTLTYNLSCHSKASNLTLDVKTYSFYKLLQAALSNPVFMRDGGVLGFNSHYSYVFDTRWADLLTPINAIEDKADQLSSIVHSDKFIQLSKDKQLKVLRDVGIEDVYCQQILDAFPSDFPLLKGADRILAESAKSLGLPIYVRPFLSYKKENLNFKYAFKEFSQQLYEDFGFGKLYHGNGVNPSQLFGDAFCICKAQDITWCQKLLYHQPAEATLHYRKEPSVDLQHKSSAILIRIPEFRQKLVAVSTGECCDLTAAEDGMIKDFKDIVQELNVFHEEMQELNKQIKALLDNQHIDAAEGLVDKLEENLISYLQQEGTMCLSKQTETILNLLGELNTLNSSKAQ